jgi:hypothetical protein
MMTLNDGRKAIQRLLSGFLNEAGFRERKRLTFTRGEGERVEIIAFSIRKAAGDRVCFSVGVGVRFERLERARADQQELFYTVGKPLHLLCDDSRFREWCVDETSEPNFVGEVVELLMQYGIPFVERYREIEDIELALKSERPSDWFTLTPSERRELLMTIEGLRGSVV